MGTLVSTAIAQPIADRPLWENGGAGPGPGTLGSEVPVGSAVPVAYPGAWSAVLGDSWQMEHGEALPVGVPIYGAAARGSAAGNSAIQHSLPPLAPSTGPPPGRAPRPKALDVGDIVVDAEPPSSTGSRLPSGAEPVAGRPRRSSRRRTSAIEPAGPGGQPFSPYSPSTAVGGGAVPGRSLLSGGGSSPLGGSTPSSVVVPTPRGGAHPSNVRFIVRQVSSRVAMSSASLGTPADAGPARLIDVPRVADIGTAIRLLCAAADVVSEVPFSRTPDSGVSEGVAVRYVLPGPEGELIALESSNDWQLLLSEYDAMPPGARMRVFVQELMTSRRSHRHNHSGLPHSGRCDHQNPHPPLGPRPPAAPRMRTRHRRGTSMPHADALDGGTASWNVAAPGSHGADTAPVTTPVSAPRGGNPEHAESPVGGTPRSGGAALAHALLAGVDDRARAGRLSSQWPMQGQTNLRGYRSDRISRPERPAGAPPGTTAAPHHHRLRHHSSHAHNSTDVMGEGTPPLGLYHLVDPRPTPPSTVGAAVGGDWPVRPGVDVAFDSIGGAGASDRITSRAVRGLSAASRTSGDASVIIHASPGSPGTAAGIADAMQSSGEGARRGGRRSHFSPRASRPSAIRLGPDGSPGEADLGHRRTASQDIVHLSTSVGPLDRHSPQDPSAFSPQQRMTKKGVLRRSATGERDMGPHHQRLSLSRHPAPDEGLEVALYSPAGSHDGTGGAAAPSLPDAMMAPVAEGLHRSGRGGGRASTRQGVHVRVHSLSVPADGNMGDDDFSDLDTNKHAVHHDGRGDHAHDGSSSASDDSLSASDDSGNDVIGTGVDSTRVTASTVARILRAHAAQAHAARATRRPRYRWLSFNQLMHQTGEPPEVNGLSVGASMTLGSGLEPIDEDRSVAAVDSVAPSVGPLSDGRTLTRASTSAASGGVPQGVPAEDSLIDRFLAGAGKAPGPTSMSSEGVVGEPNADGAADSGVVDSPSRPCETAAEAVTTSTPPPLPTGDCSAPPGDGGGFVTRPPGWKPDTAVASGVKGLSTLAEGVARLGLDTTVSEQDVDDAGTSKSPRRQAQQRPSILMVSESAIDGRWATGGVWEAGDGRQAEEPEIPSTLQRIPPDDMTKVKELGRGQFGSVWHERWRGVDVAVKEMHGAGPTVRAEMIREAATLATLRHPCVVGFFGIILSDDVSAAVLEYVRDGNLRRALRTLRRDQALLDSPRRLWRLRVGAALGAARGVEYLHSQSIIHFDLKADNLLGDLSDLERPVVKVGDLGLSKQKASTFVSGNMRGTLPWMAPELFGNPSALGGEPSGPNLAGEPSEALSTLGAEGSKAELELEEGCVTEKVDVFSFGVTLWELWTLGDPPYAARTMAQVLHGVMTGSLRPQIPEDCDTQWAKLMRSCWHRKSARRPTMSAVCNVLEQMARREGPVVAERRG